MAMLKRVSTISFRLTASSYSSSSRSRVRRQNSHCHSRGPSWYCPNLEVTHRKCMTTLHVQQSSTSAPGPATPMQSSQ